MNRTRRLILLLLVLAPHVASSATLLREYRLDGTFADQLGGPSLVSTGGVLGALGYDFAAGHGLSVAGALANTGHYAIEMFFSLEETNDYRKLIDFQNLTSDVGLYNLDGVLNFYDYSLAATQSLAPGRLIHLVVCRNGTNLLFTTYVDGVLQNSIIDDSSSAVFSGTNGIIHFLRDDAVTGVENPRGYLEYIRIYNGPLSAAEASALFAAAPPRLQASRQGNSVQLCWKSVVGKTYQVQRRSALGTGSWSNLGSAQNGNGAILCQSDSLAAAPSQRVYRLRITPP